MLVLSRKIGEEIVIEGNGRTVIRIISVSAVQSQVKVGLEAPPEISILRAELRGRVPPPNPWAAAALPEVTVLAAGQVPGG